MATYLHLSLLYLAPFYTSIFPLVYCEIIAIPVNQALLCIIQKPKINFDTIIESSGHYFMEHFVSVTPNQCSQDTLYFH